MIISTKQQRSHKLNYCGWNIKIGIHFLSIFILLLNCTVVYYYIIIDNIWQFKNWFSKMDNKTKFCKSSQICIEYFLNLIWTFNICLLKIWYCTSPSPVNRTVLVYTPLPAYIFVPREIAFCKILVHSCLIHGHGALATKH